LLNHREIAISTLRSRFRPQKTTNLKKSQLGRRFSIFFLAVGCAEIFFPTRRILVSDALEITILKHRISPCDQLLRSRANTAVSQVENLRSELVSTNSLSFKTYLKELTSIPILCTLAWYLTNELRQMATVQQYQSWLRFKTSDEEEIKFYTESYSIIGLQQVQKFVIGAKIRVCWSTRNDFRPQNPRSPVCLKI